MIVVMAKVPRPGFSKTRLIPALGPDRAAGLSAAMSEDVFATVASTGLPWRIAVAGPMADPWVAGLPAPSEAQAGLDEKIIIVWEIVVFLAAYLKVQRCRKKKNPWRS